MIINLTEQEIFKIRELLIGELNTLQDACVIEEQKSLASLVSKLEQTVLAEHFLSKRRIS